MFKENDFEYPELFVLCSSVIKKEKLQNIPAPQVYHEWVEVIEKITDQWWNSKYFLNFSKKELKMKLKNKLNFGGVTSTVIV